MFTPTLWLGRPGGTHEKPSKMLFSREGLRCGSVGALNPRRSRTLTHSSWYTSWASLGHLQLLHVFLKEQRRIFNSRINRSRRSEFPSTSQARFHSYVPRIPTDEMYWLSGTSRIMKRLQEQARVLTQKRSKYFTIPLTYIMKRLQEQARVLTQKRSKYFTIPLT